MLGEGQDTVYDTLAEVDGDTINGFAAGNHLTISDAAHVVSRTLDKADNTLAVLSDGNATTATLTFAGGLLKNLFLQSGGRLVLRKISESNDAIYGTNCSYEIDALAVDDVVYGLGGADRLYGGIGKDLMIDHGQLTMLGGNCEDTLNVWSKIHRPS